MNNVPNSHPVTHWVQLLTIFLVPGALQGLAFYWISAQGIGDSALDWRAFTLWFLAIAPTCVFLISVPSDRWRSLVVSVLLGLLLSALLFTDARDSVGSGPGDSVPQRVVMIGIVCSSIVVFVSLPFYRTVWQRGFPFKYYASLFEFAWNQTVCVLIGLAFTGVVAALMALSVSLFKAVGVRLESIVFATPLLGAWLGAAFATAIGVTRQSDAIVLGTRVLILALLRVLIPVMLPISVAFIVLVGVVGVDQLDTGLSIALIVIAAAIVGIILCSARIGDATEKLTGLQQILTRGMAVVVLPLSLLAAHALWFRITEHGWTGTRVLAAVIIVLCVLYGLGYMLAAIRQPRTVIPTVNIGMAGICALVAVLLMTPLLDPDRLGVRDQMARFYSGRTTAEELDLRYLKFSSGQVGLDALQALSMRAEANEAPLRGRFEELSGVDYYADPPSAEQWEDAEEGRAVARALEAGTLRVLREEATGWSPAGDAVMMFGSLEGQFSPWSLFEFHMFCLTQGLECAYLATLRHNAIVAIRVGDASLLMYRVPDARVSGMKHDPQLLTELNAAKGLTPETLDAWFAALDRGEVTVEMVQVPAIAIGNFQVLQDDPIRLP